jgi:hypothetical protein
MPELSALSFVQRRLWYLDRLEGTGTVFCSHRCFRITGNFDLEKFRAALRIMVTRHLMLRTVFVCDASSTDGLAQKLLEDREIPVKIFDFSTSGLGEVQAFDVFDDMIREPFSLEFGPLMRVVAARTSHDRHLLLFSLHQIIADGWGEKIFFRDLGAAYSVEVTDRLRLPMISMQYAQWAEWQRGQLTDARREELLRWWVAKLEGAPNQIGLPFHQPPLSVPHPGRRLEHAVPWEVMSALRALVKREKTTAYTALMTIYGMSIGIHSSQRDILIGTPESNREHPGVENVLGFFLNTIVLRVDLSGDLGFREQLHRMRAAIVEAYAHKDLPFEILVAELDLVRVQNLTPLVQVCFTYRTIDNGGSLDLRGSTVDEIVIENSASRFALTMGVDETYRGATLWALFNSNILGEATVRSIMSTYLELLRQALSAPDSLIFQGKPRPMPSTCCGDVPLEISAPKTSEWSGTEIPLSAMSILQSIMAELLGIRLVGSDDNFFELGGHSMLAIRFFARAQQALGRRADVREWLRRPTVSGFLQCCWPEDDHRD